MIFSANFQQVETPPQLSLQDKLDHLIWRFGESLSQADRARSVQHDLLVAKLNGLIVAEANVCTVHTVVDQEEFPEAVFDTGVLA